MLDLRAEKAKREQQYSMEDQRALEAQEKHGLQAARHLKNELEEITTAAESAKDVGAQSVVWQRYLLFMSQYDLEHLPANLEIMSKVPDINLIIRSAAKLGNVPPQKLAEMIDLIRKTKLRQ